MASEPWSQFNLNKILPDRNDPRNPSDLLEQIDNALRNSRSQMRSGPSGFLLDGSSLEVLSAPMADPVQPLPMAPPGVVFQSGAAEAPFPMDPPPLQSIPMRSPNLTPQDLAPVKDTTSELFTRITELLKTVDDLKQLKEKAELDRSDLAKKYEDVQSSLVLGMRELDQARTECEAAKKEAYYAKEEAVESKKHLAQAKEMWMKESARATKLREQLDKAEVDMAAKDKELAKLNEVWKKTETENTNLKHLLNKSNEIVSTKILTPQSFDNSFAASDSYFVRGATLANLTQRNVPAGSSSGTVGGGRNSLFTNPQLHEGGSSTFDQPLSARHLSNVNEDSHATLSTLPGVQGLSSKYLQLCLINDGVLFEDEIIQIGVKAKYTGLGEGVLGIYYGNKTSGVLQNFQTRFTPSENLHLTTSPIPTQLGPKNQTCQRVSAQIDGAFAESPLVVVSFLLPDNTPRKIPLRLPVTVSKFMQGRHLSVEEFFSNWRMQLFLLNDASVLVNVTMNLAQIARAAQLGGGLQLHHQIDEVADNLVLAGQFPSDSPEGIRCATIPEALVLVRVEVGTGPNSGRARIAVRSNDGSVAEAVRNCLANQLRCD